MREEKSFNFIKTLLSVEFLYVLFLFSYQYKHAHPLFQTGDPTLITGLALWIAFPFLCRQTAVPGRWDGVTCAILGFIGWAVVSYTWSLSNPLGYSYAISKALCLILYTLLGYLVAHHILAHGKREQHLLNAFLLFGGAVSLWALISVCLNPHSIVDVLGTNYLVTGQTMGVFFLCLLPIMDQKFQDKNWLTFGSFLMLFSTVFFAFLNLGGRGPIVAMGIALAGWCIVKALNREFSKDFLRFLILTLGGTVSVYFLIKWGLKSQESHFFKRVSLVAGGVEADLSLQERFLYYRSAFQAFLEHPWIGVGIGGWPVYEGLGARELHPHNLFLETLSETGLVGLGWLCAVAVTFAKRAWCLLKGADRITQTLLMLWFFAFANALKSGDLNDNILLFSITGLLSIKKPPRRVA